MKNFIKNIKKSIATLVMLATITGFAHTLEPLTKNNKTTVFTINHVKSGNLLSIKDHNGIILYSELIEANGIYQKGFGLTQLPNGNYFFEIEKDLEIDTIPFTVELNKVIFNKKDEAVFFKPLAKHHKDKVYITKLAPNYEPLDINVYGNVNGYYELLYSEKIENSQIIERVLKLKKNIQYKIVLNSDNKGYTKFIN